jgi:hypothetical protein
MIAIATEWSIPTLAAAIAALESVGLDGPTATERLCRALRDGAVTAEGNLPLNALPDVDRAWASNPAVRRERIDSADSFREIDWERNRVGRYREIEIHNVEFDRLLSAQQRQAKSPVPRPPDAEVQRLIRDYLSEVANSGENPSQRAASDFAKKTLPGTTRDRSTSASGGSSEG